MTARTHDMFAFATLLTATVQYPPATINMPTLISCLIANIVGSLLPDMDQASNRLWDLFPAGNFVGKIFRRVFISHRTISHSLLGFFIFYKFFEWSLPKLLNTTYIDAKLVFASIMLGIASHLIADGITKDGLPLLFPFSLKIGFPPLKALRIRTDTWVEHILVLPLVVLFIIWFANENRHVLVNLLSQLAK